MSILNGDRFQVKRLFVLPGKKLSLQKHFHRLHNTGSVVLEMIEIQAGSYLEEDDTVRVITEFGRD